MNRDQFIAALEEALAVPAGTFAPGRPLADISQWDSLAVVEFQALADERLGLQIQPPAIGACSTVDDIVALVRTKLA